MTDATVDLTPEAVLAQIGVFEEQVRQLLVSKGIHYYWREPLGPLAVGLPASVRWDCLPQRRALLPASVSQLALSACLYAHFHVQFLLQTT